jgi:hypothetical protein
MKTAKKLLWMVTLLTVTIAASAQSEPGTFSIYPRIGINSSNLSNDEIYTTNDGLDGAHQSKRKIGLVAGAELEYQWLTGLSLTGGVMYSMQGCKFGDIETSTNPKETQNFKESLSYLIVPLMANLYVERNLAVKVGVQMGYMLSSNITSAYKTPISTEATSEGSSLYRKFDFSIPVGISYQYQNIVLDLRYNFGLNNVYKKDLLNSKNQVLMMTLGYKIEL